MVFSEADLVDGELDLREAGLYVVAQITGGIAGAITANLMFDLAAIDISDKDRGGFNLLFSEGIATIGLILMIELVLVLGVWAFSPEAGTLAAAPLGAAPVPAVNLPHLW